MPSPTIPTLLVGRIPYWNLLPLYREIEGRHLDFLQLKKGLPTQINRWLQEGQVKLAPCSSICLVSQPEHEMALPLGVVSNGAAGSVYLGFQREHLDAFESLAPRRKALAALFAAQIQRFGSDARAIADTLTHLWESDLDFPQLRLPPLKITSASATSATLGRLLYRLWYGRATCEALERTQAHLPDQGRRPVELLIGDEALVRRHHFYRTLDLGLEWKQMTGLPFVYAVWQSRGACLNGWRRKILELGEIAETKMHVQPSTYFPDTPPLDEHGHEIHLGEYWRGLSYRLGAQEFNGLLVFLCLARNFHVVPRHDAATAKIVRWQAVSHQYS